MSKTLGSDRQKALIAFLKERRKAAGLSQEDLATKMGEYQSFIARMESGQRRVDVVEFIALAEVLNFDAAKALAKITKAE